MVMASKIRTAGLAIMGLLLSPVLILCVLGMGILLFVNHIVTLYREG